MMTGGQSMFEESPYGEDRSKSVKRTEKKDSLGDRMKANYEDRTRLFLPRRTYTILRLDGKAFHTYTRGMFKPFDPGFSERMNIAAKALLAEAMGARFAYLQSDEISVLLTDFEKESTEAWFDGNIQKIVSVASSIVSVVFTGPHAPAFFDARVFTIPDAVEVENYFIWRQKDAERNSVQMVAQSLYSHKQLHGKSCSELHDMIVAAGQNWNDYSSASKRGRAVVKEEYEVTVTSVPGTDAVMRTRWVTADVPVFTKDREWLRLRIPRMC